jgi:hypothetical protein
MKDGELRAALRFLQDAAVWSVVTTSRAQSTLGDWSTALLRLLSIDAATSCPGPAKERREAVNSALPSAEKENRLVPSRNPLSAAYCHTRN